MKLLKKAAAFITAFAVWATSPGGPQLISITASASSVHIWDGTADTSWYTGDENSYDIYTPEELAGFAELCRTQPDGTWDNIVINLMDDIVLNDTANWQTWEKTPPKNSWKTIGAGNYRAFSGGFNGNGHTISGLYMESSNGLFEYGCVGLFDVVRGAMIRDLKMEKCVIIGMGNGKAGLLATRSENCYVENVEIKDIIVGCGQTAGGLIGEIGRYDIVDVVLGNLMLAAMTGLVLNPLLYIEQIKQYKGTVVNNCKVTNALFLPDKADGAYWEHLNGGLTGWMSGGAVINSVSENCTFAIDRVFSSYKLGAITAGKKYNDDYDNVVKNCYSYNFKITGKNPKQADADLVTSPSGDEYLSPDLITKLGDGFVSMPNGTPVITSLKDSVLNEEIVPGDFDNSGKIEMSDVSYALKAYVNDTALDYRTFKASDMDSNGVLNLTDVTLLLRKYVNS